MQSLAHCVNVIRNNAYAILKEVLAERNPFSYMYFELQCMASLHPRSSNVVPLPPPPTRRCFVLARVNLTLPSYKLDGPRNRHQSEQQASSAAALCAVF